MAKPAYLINVLSTGDSHLISNRLGAAWKTKKGNYKIQMHYYSTQPENLVYLRDPEQDEPTAALEQHLRRREQGNCIPHYRIFSAKQLPGGNVWFENHGEIVKPEGSNLMLLQVRTLPYPTESYSLYFAHIKKPEPANKFDATMPFEEERAALNEEDFI